VVVVITLSKDIVRAAAFRRPAGLRRVAVLRVPLPEARFRGAALRRFASGVALTEVFSCSIVPSRFVVEASFPPGKTRSAARCRPSRAI